MSYLFWTKEEELKLQELSGKYSFEQLIIFFPNRSAKSLQKKSIKLGLKSKYRFTKHSHDKNCWKTLTPSSCYLAGFIAADGSLHSGRKQLTVCINTKDIQVLNEIKDYTKYTGNIRSYQRKNYNKETLKNVSYIIIGGCGEWYDDFKYNFGIIPNKTFYFPPPSLKEEILKWSYVIGYIDGDGWITHKENLRITLGIASCNENILKWIINLIDQKIKIPQRTQGFQMKPIRIAKGKNKVRYFTIQGYKAGVLIDYLRQFPIPKLSRKWDQPAVLQYIEQQKQKHPEYFLKPPSF